MTITMKYKLKALVLACIISCSLCCKRTTSPELLYRNEIENWTTDPYLQNLVIKFCSDRQVFASYMAKPNSNDNKQRLRLWNVSDGKELATTFPDDVGYAFGVNSQTIAIKVGNDVRIVNFRDGTLLHTYPIRSLSKGEAYNLLATNDDFFVVYYPDGLSSSVDQIELRRISDNKLLLNFKAESQPITQLAISPDGQQLAIGYGQPFITDTGPSFRKYAIDLLHIEDGKLIHKLNGHNHSVLSLCFSPDGQYLASGGGASDGKLRLWNVKDGQLLAEFATKKPTSLQRWEFQRWEQVRAIDFSNDGKLVVFGGGDNIVYVIDVSNRQILKELSGHQGMILGVGFDYSKKEIHSVSADGIINIWKLN